MVWYTTEDARRDAERQKNESLHPDCSTLCALGEPCSITSTGRCDALEPRETQGDE